MNNQQLPLGVVLTVVSAEIRCFGKVRLAAHPWRSPPHPYDFLMSLRHIYRDSTSISLFPRFPRGSRPHGGSRVFRPAHRNAASRSFRAAKTSSSPTAWRIVSQLVTDGLPVTRAECVSDAGNDLANEKQRERRHSVRNQQRAVWLPDKRLHRQCWTISRFAIRPNWEPHVLEWPESSRKRPL